MYLVAAMAPVAMAPPAPDETGMAVIDRFVPQRGVKFIRLFGQSRDSGCGLAVEAGVTSVCAIALVRQVRDQPVYVTRLGVSFEGAGGLQNGVDHPFVRSERLRVIRLRFRLRVLASQLNALFPVHAAPIRMVA